MFSPLFRRSKPLVFASDLDFNLHPKRFPVSVNHLLTGFSQGYKINGYSGPRAPKEYSNISYANTDALVIVPWATQRGLFTPLPSQACRYTPLGSFPRNTPPNCVPYSSFVSEMPPHQCHRPRSSRVLFFAIRFTLTMQLPYFRISAQNASCPS